jgi:hypothetical protein
MKKMTMRERMQAVLQGREPDETPFIQYDNAAAPNDEIWASIGRENMGIVRWSKLHEYAYTDTQFASENITHNGLAGKRKFIITPKGKLTQEVVYEPAHNTEFIIKHYVNTLSDYEILISYLKDISVVANHKQYLRDAEVLGGDGMPMATFSRTAYQQLWIQWVSLQDLSYHLADAPDIVEECISLLNGIHRKEFEAVVNASRQFPVYYVNFPDNITAPAIGVTKFCKYCVPMYNELAEMLDPKIPIAVHMDGDLLPLGKAIAESKVNALDSMSPPPDNDTSVAKALAMWPDKKLLVNFPSSVHLASPEVIYRQAEQLLNESGDSNRMWIQISENVPAGLWKISYPEIVRAIKDHAYPKSRRQK